MSFYKPLDNINKADVVLFKEIGAFDESMKYPAHQCRVTVNGEDMFWTLSKSKHDQLTKAGFKQGDTVLIQKWKESDRKGYNFVSPDKKNPYAQPAAAENIVPSQAFLDDFKVTPPKDHFQEKMSRGASWNNAFAYCVGTMPAETIRDKSIEEFCTVVSAIAEQITKHQAKFVNNE